MKKRKSFIVKSAFIAILVAVTLHACKGVDEITKGVNVVVDNNIFKKKVSVQMFDPANQQNLEGENKLSVSVLGSDASKLTTDAGDDISKLKVIDGVVNINVNPNKSKDSELVKFVLKFEGDGYLTTTVPILLAEADSSAYVSANIIRKMDTPKGVDFISKKTALSNNTLTNDFAVKTSGIKAVTSTKVEIPAGTVFKDKNGKAISGTDLKVEVTHFNSEDDESLASFPGSFSPIAITDENGETVRDSYFITVGFASIDMKVGNTEVKQFSKPVTITMEISPDFINPDTNKKVKIGDSVPVWSYSKDDGKWDYHIKGIVSKDANKKLIVRYTTTHLSWYNLDYKGRRCSGWRYVNGSYTFVEGVALKFSMNGVDRNNAPRLYMDYVFAGTNQSVSNWSGKSRTLYHGKTITPYNAPSRNLQLLVYSGKSRYRKGELLHRSQSFYPCGSNSVNINLDGIVSKLPKYVNVNIDYQGKCGNKTIAPTMYLRMKDPNHRYWEYVGYVRRGKITLKGVELNKPYTFKTYYGGKSYEHTMTFDKTEYKNHNYQIPSRMCEGI